ncbi:MAG: RNA-binding protein [Bacillota bacterium]
MYERNLAEKYKDYDDRLLVNSILDAAEYCVKNFTVKHTHFLDPRQQNITAEILGKLKGVCYFFDGGIEEAERKICFLYHEDIDNISADTAISKIRFSWFEAGKKLSHRDFLGSFIGSGIKREMIGDIILEDNAAYLICKSEILSFILLNISRIGNIAVRSQVMQDDIRKTDNYKHISTTVSSLRLDCIIGSAYGISRSKALEAVKGGKVKLNWEDTDSPSREVKPGDTISLRGKGRAVLEEVSGNTKKDRIKISIKKFI